MLFYCFSEERSQFFRCRYCLVGEVVECDVVEEVVYECFELRDVFLLFSFAEFSVDLC